jgi:transposase
VGKSKTTPEERREAIAMLAAGKTGDEVAKLFGVSRVRVYQWKVEAKKAQEGLGSAPTYADLARDVQQLKVDMQLVKELLATRRKK